MKCKHENVFVTEELLWRGWKDEEGNYDLKNKEGEITVVTCIDCGHEFAQEEIDKIQDKMNFC